MLVSSSERWARLPRGRAFEIESLAGAFRSQNENRLEMLLEASKLIFSIYFSVWKIKTRDN